MLGGAFQLAQFEPRVRTCRRPRPRCPPASTAAPRTACRRRAAGATRPGTCPPRTRSAGPGARSRSAGSTRTPTRSGSRPRRAPRPPCPPRGAAQRALARLAGEPLGLGVRDRRRAARAEHRMHPGGDGGRAAAAAAGTRRRAPRSRRCRGLRTRRARAADSRCGIMFRPVMSRCERDSRHSKPASAAVAAGELEEPSALARLPSRGHGERQRRRVRAGVSVNVLASAGAASTSAASTAR